MNGKKARAIRRRVYGHEFSPRFRELYRYGSVVRNKPGSKRHIYQVSKRFYTRMIPARFRATAIV